MKFIRLAASGLIVNSLVTPTSVILIPREKDPYFGKWTLPGGHVEQNENINQAIIREIREECQLDVQVHDRFYVQEINNYVIVTKLCTLQLWSPQKNSPHYKEYGLDRLPDPESCTPNLHFIIKQMLSNG